MKLFHGVDRAKHWLECPKCGPIQRHGITAALADEQAGMDCPCCVPGAKWPRYNRTTGKDWPVYGPDGSIIR